ncbi:MAG: hypothetical protein J6S92_03240 [Oscillospiraceae bacterium]|nr:hypothetical protein [Oscillospiraceae bacterium]
MKHGIRIILAAAGAGALLLTGCESEQKEPAKTTAAGGTAPVTQTAANSTAAAGDGTARDTDLSARYGEYMKYSFGEDYKFECFSTDEYHYDYYDLSYHDSTGRLRSTGGSADIMIIPYDERRSSQQDASKEDYYADYMEAVVTGQIAGIYEDGLKEKVIEPSFPSYNPDPKVIRGNLGGASLIVQSKAVITRSTGDAAALPFVAGRLEPGTGWKVCAADFYSVAADPQWFVTVTAVVDEDADPQPIIKQMQDAEARFREEAKTPQNYSMIVTHSKDGKSTVLWRADLVLGEYVDYDRCIEVDPHFTPLDDAREKLLTQP